MPSLEQELAEIGYKAESKEQYDKRQEKLEKEAASKLDERVKSSSGVADKCPFCISQKKSNKVVVNGTSLQCIRCGKNWEEKQLGKPYSIELERGDWWVRENESRKLQEHKGSTGSDEAGKK